MVPHAVIRHQVAPVGAASTLRSAPEPSSPGSCRWRASTSPRPHTRPSLGATPAVTPWSSESHRQRAAPPNTVASRSHGTLRHVANVLNGACGGALAGEAGAGSGFLRHGAGRWDGMHMAAAQESSSCDTSRHLLRTAKRSLRGEESSGKASRIGKEQLGKGRSCRARASNGDGPSGMSAALPSPPAGFILNEAGEVVLMAPEAKRLLVLEDEEGRRLECVIRRTFLSSTGLQFFLLYPLDVPVIIYKVSEATGGLIETEESEVQDAFNQAAYALARRNFHLVLSAFVLTVRGAVCFDQEDVTSINVEYGLGIGSDLAEGVEIASFVHKGAKFVVYTPFDPLLFVAYRDPDTGAVLVAEDEEDLSDARVEEAIEEEQEYQRMVNEEEEMLQLAKAAKAKAGSM